ncbi:MAG: hypothetical protein IJN70_03350 [Clostridia bacterium]|nr:hypothetical protein [Clostridia bacterium]
MYLKYEDCGDKIILNLPAEKSWKICFKLFDDDVAEDYNLYLMMDGETVLLLDTEYLCQGRPELSYRAVGELYEEIIDVIAEKLEKEPDLRVIDIMAAMNKLLAEKYEKKWLDAGFITPDANGSW